MRSRDVQKAIFYATQATLANPTNYLAQLSLAEMYEQAGHKQMALDSYEEALRLLHAEGGGQHEESTLQKKIEQLRTANAQ
jgi:Tfp pilus assembly protein PilF